MFSKETLKLLTSFLFVATSSLAGIIEQSLEIATAHNIYPASSQLTNLAHNSAVQARNAVNIQQTAANHAAFNAKNALAQSASNAARTAHAALAGKQVQVQRIQLRLAEAQNQLQMQTTQFKSIQKIAEMIRNSAQEAKEQIDRISEMLVAGKRTADSARQAADDAGKLRAEQNIAVQEVKKRVEELSGKLEDRLHEVEEAKKSSGFAKIGADSTDLVLSVKRDEEIKDGEIVAESVVEDIEDDKKKG